MLIKNFIEYILDKLGLVIIRKRRFDDILLTRRIQRIIEEYQIDCFIDVGANVGQYRDYLRKHVGYGGLIISFEPDPDNVEYLEKASQFDHQWFIQNYALGKENTKLNLNIMEYSAFNSFLEPDNRGVDRYIKKNSIKTRVEVAVRRLDEVLPELKKLYKFERVFLKLDTQGFDLEVFDGALGCIGLILGVQTEVSVLPIYKNMPELGDSLKLFKSMGFEVSGLYPVNEARFPHAIEFDCIYLPKEYH